MVLHMVLRTVLLVHVVLHVARHGAREYFLGKPWTGTNGTHERHLKLSVEGWDVT